MIEKYKMHTAEKNEKKPTEPTVQTAVKPDVQEALEILLGDNAAGKKKKRASLSDKAKAFRSRMNALEEREAEHE